MADIRITGRMVNFSRLTFDTNDHDAIRQQLANTLNEGAYQGTLVIIDSTVEQELIALIQF
jgi:septum site-determining protein MinC